MKTSEIENKIKKLKHDSKIVEFLMDAEKDGFRHAVCLNYETGKIEKLILTSNEKINPKILIGLVWMDPLNPLFDIAKNEKEKKEYISTMIENVIDVDFIKECITDEC